MNRSRKILAMTEKLNEKDEASCSKDLSHPPRSSTSEVAEIPPSFSRESSPPSLSSDVEKAFSSDDSIFDQDYVPPTNQESISEDDKEFPSNTKETLASSSNCQTSTTPKKWSTKVRKQRTALMNTGKSYETVSGKQIPARKLKPLKECRKKCSIQLTDEVRQQIFEEYWQLGSHDKRANYVANSVSKNEIKRPRSVAENARRRNVTYEYSFHLYGKHVSVCKSCFCATIDENETFIRNSVSKKVDSASGIILEDNRGKKSTVNKKSNEEIAAVLEHINSFPAYESHYTRRTNDKKYLPSHLNLSKMYALYKEKCDKPVSRMIYEREFHKCKLKFKKPSVDTCHKCDTLHIKITVSSNEEEKLSTTNELTAHQEKADFAYSSKKQDKVESQANLKKKCFSFDLQQCLPTPLLTSSVAFYKRQLWTFNLTIHDNANGNSTNYMWHEAIAGRGANEVASCLYLHLKNLDPNIEEVTFYSDTCQGQNKNSHVSAMFLSFFMTESTNLKIINHKFLEPGHTHMECDVDHSMIEKQKKSTATSIYHPHDWFQLVRRTGKKNKFEVVEMNINNFYNFSRLLTNTLVYRKKNTNKKQFKLHDVTWLQYRCDEVGIINYKNVLHKEADFERVNFLRRRDRLDIHIEKRYLTSVPISVEKKKDLVDLLHLIPPVFHPFYNSLVTTDDLTEEDPDLIEYSDN